MMDTNVPNVVETSDNSSLADISTLSDSVQFRSRRSLFDGLQQSSSVSVLPTSNELAREQRQNSILTVNKLRFSTLGIHGRDTEMGVISDTYHKVLEMSPDKEKTTKELMLVHGESGVGKTELVKNTLSRLARKTKAVPRDYLPLHVFGKFDLNENNEPCSGLAMCCRQICREILAMRDTEEPSSQQDFSRLRQRLNDELEEELPLLMEFLPSLQNIVSDEKQLQHVDAADTTTNPQQGDAHKNQETNKARFNYSVRKFIRLVSDHFLPLVLVLDDLQWGDPASLDLLEVLLTDRENPRLVVIGIYRSEEVHGPGKDSENTHPLVEMINRLREKHRDHQLHLTDIPVNNLSIENVNQIVMDLLSIDEPQRTMELSKICHKRSAGNVFHLLTFVKMLKAEGWLQFQVGLFKWTWDIAKIESETAATDNVVDLMTRKIQQLPKAVGNTLTIAACLGATFDKSILDVVWNSFESHSRYFSTGDQSIGDQTNSENISVEECLEIGVKEGLLERRKTDNGFQWVHDRVQESAFTLLGTDELNVLKSRIGSVLSHELEGRELDGLIFVVVNLLNKGANASDKPSGVDTSSTRATLPELNLQAARKAISLAAFASAARYAKQGVNFLPENRWSSAEHYPITLELYSLAAEVESYLGNMESMQIYYSEILKQTDRPITDKLRVYHVKTDTLINATSYAEATDILLDVLQKIGCKFPRAQALRIGSGLAGLIRTKNQLKKLSAEDIAKMPTSDNVLHLQKLRLLDRLCHSSYGCAKFELCLLANMRMIRLSLKNGLNEYSAPAFATFALLILSSAEDFAGAVKIANDALLMLEKVKSKGGVSRTLYMAKSIVLPCRTPLQTLFKSFLEGYRAGMNSGDTGSAMNVSCLAVHASASFPI